MGVECWRSFQSPGWKLHELDTGAESRFALSPEGAPAAAPQTVKRCGVTLSECWDGEPRDSKRWVVMKGGRGSQSHGFKHSHHAHELANSAHGWSHCAGSSRRWGQDRWMWRWASSRVSDGNEPNHKTKLPRGNKRGILLVTWLVCLSNLRCKHTDMLKGAAMHMNSRMEIHEHTRNHARKHRTLSNYAKVNWLYFLVPCYIKTRKTEEFISADKYNDAELFGANSFYWSYVGRVSNK